VVGALEEALVVPSALAGLEASAIDVGGGRGAHGAADDSIATTGVDSERSPSSTWRIRGSATSSAPRPAAGSGREAGSGASGC